MTASGRWPTWTMESAAWSLAGRNQYKSFEVLRIALEGLKAQSAILDGEIVALDSDGVSQFKELS
jgi:ATP-dependent DNA ligase